MIGLAARGLHISLACHVRLVMVVSAFGFQDWQSRGSLDPSRIAAQVVSGIGFLGAGVIIFQRDREIVRGLTTAASVWMVAGIGLAVGGGMYLISVVSTVTHHATGRDERRRPRDWSRSPPLTSPHPGGP